MWYHAFVSDVYAIVRSIRASAFSRNRHFDAHATPEGLKARRLHRFLKGIERDLESATAVRVRRQGNQWVVMMELASVRLTRAVTLTREEHALLVENPRLAELLQAA